MKAPPGGKIWSRTFGQILVPFYHQERYCAFSPISGPIACNEAGFGLYDYNARFYDPYLNRFVSADTIVPDPANPQSLNRYSYVCNNPLKYTDRSGHRLEPVWWRLVGLAQKWALERLYGPGANEAFYGRGPDHRGLAVVKQHQSAIQKVTGAPPIYVAASIAVQSQWQNDFIDSAEPLIQGDSTPSVGIAQLESSEVEGDPSDPRTAALGMATKIQRSMDLCAECSPTDQAIIATLAQNRVNGFNQQSMDTILKHRNPNGTINWNGYFGTLPSPAESMGPRGPMFEERTGGRPWAQFQVQLFANDLQALVEQGWILPEGVDLEYIQRVAGGY